MTVNAMKPDPVEGSVEVQVARIIEQAQAEGLQLTGAGGLLPDVIKQAVEAALQVEMTDHLGYDRHAAEGRGSGNSRNGLTGKTVQTTAGPVDVAVPRDRNGTFDPVTVPKGTRRLSDFDDMIISLYAKGMTTRDIADHLEATYGARVCLTRRSRTSPTRSTSRSRNGGIGPWTRSIRSSISTRSGVYRGSWTSSLLTRGWVCDPKPKEVLTAVQG